MKITIDGTRAVADIQNDFTNMFPYLKIQFFKKGHLVFHGSPRKEILPPTTILRELNHANGDAVISEDMTVSELEEMFKSRFKLNVQVFRKSGRSWLETTYTDSWTLKKQNQEGLELGNLE